MRVGVVSGMDRETECLHTIPNAERDFVTAAGIGPERAEAAAREFTDRGVLALMSFGVCGGLTPSAEAGSVILASEVVDGDRRYPTSGEWTTRIRTAIGTALHVSEEPLAGVGRMVPSPAAKAALHAGTGAAACDMESHALARVAQAAAIPFVVVRAVSDPHDRDVPRWVLNCISREGHVRTGALALQAVRRPQAWVNLAGLAGDSKKAFRSLRGVAGLLGGGLGLP